MTMSRDQLVKEWQWLHLSLLEIQRTPEPTKEQAGGKLEASAKSKFTMDMKRQRASVTPIDKPAKFLPHTQEQIDRYVADHSRRQALSKWLTKALAVTGEVLVQSLAAYEIASAKVIGPIQAHIDQGQPLDLASIYRSQTEVLALILASRNKPAARAEKSSGEPLPQQVTKTKAKRGGKDPMNWSSSWKISLLTDLVGNQSARLEHVIISKIQGKVERSEVQRALRDLENIKWTKCGNDGICLTEKGIKEIKKKLSKSKL